MVINVGILLKHCRYLWIWKAFWLSFFALTACNPQMTSQTPWVSMEPFLEPDTPTVILDTKTPIPKTSDNPSATLMTFTPTTIPKPTATAVCINNLQFIEDLTVPDGSQVIAGSQIDKRWQIENTGTCHWNNAYRLHLLDGVALGAPEAQGLFPAKAGSVIILRILFEAPMEPGLYHSAWQAVSPTGDLFGDPIFMDIQVIPQS